jgi:phage terminase Nu1 subunit (DNA packaging protein)
MASQSDLADQFGISRQAVSDLVRRGVLPDAPPGGYEVQTCLRLYIEHLREVAAGRASDAEDALDLVEQRARLAKEQADKQAMENAVRRGELVPRSDFVKTMQTAFVHCRAKLLSLPSKLAPLMARIETPLEAQDRLTAAINEALAELASTRGVSESPGGTDSGPSADGSDEGVGAAAPPDRKRVGRPKPKAKPRSKRRARNVGHKPS